MLRRGISLSRTRSTGGTHWTVRTESSHAPKQWAMQDLICHLTTHHYDAAIPIINHPQNMTLSLSLYIYIHIYIYIYIYMYMYMYICIYTHIIAYMYMNHSESLIKSHIYSMVFRYWATFARTKSHSFVGSQGDPRPRAGSECPPSMSRRPTNGTLRALGRSPSGLDGDGDVVSNENKL